jgi:hypothetical protein
VGVQEEPDQHERTGQVRVEVKSLASQTLLHLAEIAHVKERMRAIAERLGNAVVKIGEEKEAGDWSPGSTPDDEIHPDSDESDGRSKGV